MDTLKSKTKTRVLPSWMATPVSERKVLSVKTATRKQTAAQRRARAATRAPAAETVYCMNEAEMVDVALGILIEVTSALSPLPPMAGDPSWVGTSTGNKLLGHKQEKPWEQPSLEATDKLQLSPPCSLSPHTSSPGSSSEEEDSRISSPAPGLSPPQGPEPSASPCSRSPEEEEEEEEEDALKYVREIFFS
ncbi:cell cycle regulator of non-homologous end joining isoform X3 [Mus pahari]|uniref:cell cycle regulator of non-homologous end joining isoform X3 n=1 Tax=Mus pahari TaxID=10093 RepID=UPI000A30E0E3|nr:cell cycle regulator of non-homologous end joining isoform X3 [Mus pahari]